MKLKTYMLYFPLVLAAFAVVAAWFPVPALLSVLALVALTALGVATRSATLPALPHFAFTTAASPPKETLFYIHGWPDNKEVFAKQREHFQGRYRCVFVDLPHFGSPEATKDAGFASWGYDLEELADMCAGALQRALAEAQHEQATLVIHDWGGMIGMILQQKYPHLVKRMVVMDVAWNSRPVPASFLPLLVAFGLIYQYWLMLAFLLSRCVPVLGPVLAKYMTVMMMKALRAPTSSRDERVTPLTPNMNYPYLWFQLRMCQEIFKLRAPFVERQGGKVPPLCPVLFLYGKDKGANFHGEKFEAMLKADPNHKVVALGGPDSNNGKYTGHWLGVTASTTVNKHMDEWLG